MIAASPFQSYQESVDAAMIAYGEGVAIVAQYDAVEVEYAAIRKGVGLVDGPHRGLLRLTGKDRLDFLHRMLTHDCRGIQPGGVRRAMLLNGKGRVMADMLLIHDEEQTWIDTDVHQTRLLAEELEKLLFGEDVRIEDFSQSHRRVSLHGPKATDALAWWRDAAPKEAWDYRYDEVGVAGVHIWAAAESLGRFADRAEELSQVFRLRFAGWMAFNIARIEAGRVMFNIDFGPNNLPHEAGPAVMAEAVSFTKGCYRGQEIVARMQNLGHPAKRLVGFRVEGEALPIAGVSVLAEDSPEAKIVGAVTSSTLSPMLGGSPVGFAMVKWGFHEEGKTLYVPAEGRNVAAKVQEMCFYSHPE